MKHLRYILLILVCFGFAAIGQEQPPKISYFEKDLNQAKDYSEDEPEKAIPILLQLKETAIESKDTFALAQVNSILGNCYYYLSDDSSAIGFWKEALLLGSRSGTKSFIAGVYNNLANGYSFLLPDSAVVYYKKSIALYNHLGLSSENCTQYLNLSYSFSDELFQLDSARFYVMKAKEIAESLNDTFGLAGVLYQIGSIFLEQAQLDSSLFYSQKGLRLCRLSNAKRLEENIIDNIRRAYYDAGKFEKAFHYYDTLVAIDSALNVEHNLAEVRQIVAQHEIELQEAEIKNLEEQKARIDKANTRQKVVIISSIVGLCLLLFMGFTIIKEKRRSDELLLNILPVAVAEELKATGKATAKRYESVTVLFTDFKDFSKLSDQMSAETLVEMIDEYFSAFDRIIETYGLEKVKTIGDSYMAAGGVPEPTNEHAAQVVQAGIEMQMHVASLMKKKKKVGLPFFETRIGIHTGPVVAGVVGIKKFAYDIWGDTVNTAARLEKAGEVGQVNISESAYKLVKDRFNCTHRGKIPIKNMGEIDMYFVG